MNKLPERQGRRGRDAARSHNKSWTYGKVTTFSQHELVQTHNQARLPDIQHWYFRDCPAVIGAGHLELYHRDRICGTSNDTEATTDTLLLVDDHIGAAAPGLCTGVHRVALDDARKAFHADAVVRTNVHAAGAEDTD